MTFKFSNLSISQTEELKIAYKDGKTLKELSKSIGCSIPTLSRFFKKNGVVLRPRGRYKAGS